MASFSSSRVKDLHVGRNIMKNTKLSEKKHTQGKNKSYINNVKVRSTVNVTTMMVKLTKRILKAI